MKFALFVCRIIAVLALPFISSAQAMGTLDYDMVYKVQWGDTALGTATAKWKMDETSYQFEGSVATEGTLAFFYEFEGENQITGERTSTGFRPLTFTSKSVYDDETYLVDMSFPKGIQTPVFTVEPEVKLKEVHPLRKATLRNVVDPYTAMLMALSDLQASGACEGKYRVFDGRRRSEFLLKDFGTQILTPDQSGSFGGEVHVCGSASKLIGGHKLDSDYDPDEELDFEKVKIFIGKIADDVLAPVRIEMNGFLGSITVRLDMENSRFN